MSKPNDMPAFRMRVDRGRLAPASQFEQERIDSYRNGTIVMVRLTEERDRVLIKKWWAVLGLVVKQCKTPWKTKDEASEAIKLALGIVNLTKTVGGDFLAYPKSLTELDDPDLQEAVDNMTELLSRLTGVAVDTLKKETAHIVPEADEHVDPDTGEITESGDASPQHSPADDATPPALSQQEPVASGSANDEAAGISVPNEQVTAASSSILIRFARDVLPKAADTSIPASTLSAIEKRWAVELSQLPDEDKEKAQSISRSMRAIANNKTSLESAAEFHAEMLGCTPEELGG